MPAQVGILSRKVLVMAAGGDWVSEPMYWGGYQRAELYLEAHGITSGVTGASVTFEGATHPGENANWQTIAAGTPADPTPLTAAGVNKYVRSDLYPYVRVKVSLVGADAVAELSLNGQLFDE